nr:DUF1028 domain-containing protein [Anaerolineae bacterium]
MKPLAHTFSIIALDQETGQIGIGVQSHWFAAGAIVPWAEPGIGGVASQASADTSYGKLGLGLMRAGKTAQQALAALVCSDPEKDIRQVAMIDREGNAAVHTGKRCIAHAGHQIGDHFSVQGNLLKSADVWPAMARAYQKATGDFSERLLQALEAGQDAGGDVRGRQSAALLVVPAPDDPLKRDTITNLRVDDSPHPLIDLRRLLTVQRGYEWHAQAIYAVETGDLEAARRHYTNLRGLAVGTREPQFWYATALAEHGHLEEALPIFAEVFKVEPVWRDMLDRLAAAGFFPSDKDVIEKVKSVPLDDSK